MSVYEKHSTRQMEAGPILLVDDNPLTLQILLQALSSHGYKVLITNNGESALKIVAQEKPALILLDIMMQGIDGYEVCRRLKANTDTENITHRDQWKNVQITDKTAILKKKQELNTHNSIISIILV